MLWGKEVEDHSQKRVALWGGSVWKITCEQFLIWSGQRCGGDLKDTYSILALSCPSSLMALFWPLLLSFEPAAAVSRLLEPRKRPGWRKVFYVTYLCFGNKEAERLCSYLPVLLCFLAGFCAIIEAQQEFCVPAHIRATWLDWGVLARDLLPQDPFPLMQWKGDWASAHVHCLACRGCLEALVRLWESIRDFYIAEFPSELLLLTSCGYKLLYVWGLIANFTIVFVGWRNTGQHCILQSSISFVVWLKQWKELNFFFNLTAKARYQELGWCSIYIFKLV